MKLYQNKLIVVTGGAGFIGSGVVRVLNDRGVSNIVVVDNLATSEKWKNLIGKRFVDLIHKDAFHQWLVGRESEIEAFIHLGACSDTMELDANYLLENNYRYTRRLAEYALKHGQRFIYASSASTYGDGALGFSDDHDLIEELRPMNMYGYSKQLFDLWAKREGVLKQIVGLKYFNVYGPNEYHKGRMASALVRMLPDVIHKGCVQLFKSEMPEKYADGDQRRDFIYVKDVARMTCDFLENEASGIFNIGTGAASSWKELAEALFISLKREPNIVYIDMPENLKGKYQSFTEAVMTKTCHVLGPKAETTSLIDAVKDYVPNYLMKEARW